MEGSQKTLLIDSMLLTIFTQFYRQISCQPRDKNVTGHVTVASGKKYKAHHFVTVLSLLETFESYCNHEVFGCLCVAIHLKSLRG